jgi:hypothetical protein
MTTAPELFLRTVVGFLPGRDAGAPGGPDGAPRDR